MLIRNAEVTLQEISQHFGFPGKQIPFYTASWLRDKANLLGGRVFLRMVLRPAGDIIVTACGIITYLHLSLFIRVFWQSCCMPNNTKVNQETSKWAPTVSVTWGDLQCTHAQHQKKSPALSHVLCHLCHLANSHKEKKLPGERKISHFRSSCLCDSISSSLSFNNLSIHQIHQSLFPDIFLP